MSRVVCPRFAKHGMERNDKPLGPLLVYKLVSAAGREAPWEDAATCWHTLELGVTASSGVAIDFHSKLRPHS